MAVLGVLSLAILLLVGVLHAPRDWAGVRPVLSTYVVVHLGIALYVLLPSILILVSGRYAWAANYYSEETFSRAVWLSVLALLFFLYGAGLARRRHGRTPVNQQSVGEKKSAQRWGQSTDLLLVAMLLVGLALKVVLIEYTGGIADSISRLSGYARAAAGVGTLGSGDVLLRTLSGVADGAATWGVVRAIRYRRRVSAWLLILVLTLSLSYLTIGKRLVLLLPVLCLILAIHVYRRPLTTRILPVVMALALAIGFLSLNARIFLPASVQGYDINLNNVAYAEGSLIQFYLYSLEFSSVEMITVAMSARDDILGLFGGGWDAFLTTNIQPFFYSVPRVLWAEKPMIFYDLSYGVSAALGATPFEDPTVGYASTLIGTSYLIGGVIGVSIAFLALGFISARIDMRLRFSDWTVVTIVLYSLALVVVFQFFRQGTLGWAFIVSVVQQYGTIAALLGLCLADKAPDRSRPEYSFTTTRNAG